MGTLAWKIWIILPLGEVPKDALAVASFVFFLKDVVDKVEELTKEVEQLGDIAGFRTHSTLLSS